MKKKRNDHIDKNKENQENNIIFVEINVTCNIFSTEEIRFHSNFLALIEIYVNFLTLQGDIIDQK